jgi:hypothetical protein
LVKAKAEPTFFVISATPSEAGTLDCVKHECHLIRRGLNLSENNLSSDIGMVFAINTTIVAIVT